jgi:hypothetical protein
MDWARLKVVGVTNPPVDDCNADPVPREVEPLKNSTVPEGALPALLVLIVAVRVTFVRDPIWLVGDMVSTGLSSATATEKSVKAELLN